MGIGLVNLLWHRLKSSESILVDYRIYDKKIDRKSKKTEIIKYDCDIGLIKIE